MYQLNVCLSSLLTISIPDEAQFRNTSCVPNYIFTFLFINCLYSYLHYAFNFILFLILTGIQKNKYEKYFFSKTVINLTIISKIVQKIKQDLEKKNVKFCLVRLCLKIYCKTIVFVVVHTFKSWIISKIGGRRCDPDRMFVGFTSTCVINTYHH